MQISKCSMDFEVKHSTFFWGSFRTYIIISSLHFMINKLFWPLLLYLDFTTLFNISGHQRRFLHWAWKVRQILLKSSISAWGSFTCRKSTTRDQRLYFPSEGIHTQEFYALKKSIDPGRDWTRESKIKWQVW